MKKNNKTKRKEPLNAMVSDVRRLYPDAIIEYENGHDYYNVELHCVACMVEWNNFHYKPITHDVITGEKKVMCNACGSDYMIEVTKQVIDVPVEKLTETQKKVQRDTSYCVKWLEEILDPDYMAF